jgi:outer membrane protein assembly factor BamB
MAKQQEQSPLTSEIDGDTDHQDALKKGISSKLRRVIAPRFSRHINERAKLKPHRLTRIVDTGHVKTPSKDDLEHIETIKTPSLDHLDTLEHAEIDTIKTPVVEDQHSALSNPFSLAKQLPSTPMPVLPEQFVPVEQPEKPHPLLLFALYPIKQLIRLRHYSRPIFVAVICIPLLILMSVGVLEDVQLQQVRQSVYEVNAQSGLLQWQRPITSPLEAASTDGVNSLLITTSQHQHQLIGLDARGSTQWTTPGSFYTYSLPNLASPAGTVLVALSGQPAFNPALYSMDDPLYSRPLILTLLQRQTGHVLWRRTIVASSDQLGALILGGNTEFVYVALVKTAASLNQSLAGVSLLAIRQQTGAIAWSVKGPLAIDNVRRDTGKLLVSGPNVFWQVAGRIYALNGTSGQVQWNRPIQEDNVATLPQEESHMTEIRGILIVERSTNYYVIDAASGAERGSIPNPGQDATVQNVVSGSGLAATGTTLVIYGNGQISAFNIRTLQELWSQKQLDSLQSVTISHDGTLLYVVLTDSIEGNQPAQSFVALNMSDGAAMWTFQPTNQVTFLPLHQDSYIEYAQNVLLTSICLTPLQGQCTQPYLYALNAETGATLWKYENLALSNVLMSANGTRVIFERKSSGWLDLLERLRG